MPSFVFSRLPGDSELDLEKISTKLSNEFSFRRSGERKEFGVDSSSIIKFENTLFFRYVFVEPQEIFTLEGPILVNTKVEKQIILVEGNYNLKPEGLNESKIREIAENLESIVFTQHETPTRTPLTTVSGTGYELRETDYWDSYGQEPLRMINHSSYCKYK